MTVVIVDYGSGNLRSVAKAFERVVDDLNLPLRVIVSSDPEVVAEAERIVLPGVGAFADCRAGLHRRDGMEDALNQRVRQQGYPFLGICVGMQLLADWGLEHGRHAGLGWIGGTVEALSPSDPQLKIPHMGWNSLEMVNPHPVLADLGDDPHAYFVHSYHLVPQDPACVLARTDYGGPVVAAVGQGSVVGVQFHPEKSQAVGLKVLANFLRWSV